MKCNLPGALTIAFTLILAAAATAEAGRAQGTILRVDGRPELFVVAPGNRACHIPTESVLRCLGYDRRPQVVVSRGELDGMPQPKMLLKGSDGKIYKIEGDRKRHITGPAAFKHYGYDAAAVMTVPDAQLDCIRTGDPIY